jgi:acyl-CoA hydrolase
MATPSLVTPAEAVALLRPADSLAFTLGPGQPQALLHAMGERTDWEQLELAGALLLDLYAIFSAPNVHYRSGFFGPAERFLRDSGAAIEFVPSDFRRFAPILQKDAPRVMAVAGAMPDDDGNISLSLHAGATYGETMRAAADPDRMVIVEVNEQYPRTFGLPPDHPHSIHVSQVDAVVHGDRPPIALPDAPPTEVEQAIAAHAVEHIADGATIQTGIGGVPSTVARILAEGDGGDYGVHSEMFTTGLMALHQAGKVTNAHKGQFEGISITTFAAGAPELYPFLHENEAVRFVPVEVVNSPDVIARNHGMVMINGALKIDLWGQAVADTLGDQQFSGIGGHEDFTAPSGLGLDDRSLMCLPSTVTVDGEVRSRIEPAFAAGTVVTTPRHQLDIVITEHGAAHLRGRTVRERAEALARVAHPDFRKDLLTAASKLG